jgi:transcriptional regulator with XRE-family HTH domain
MPTKEMVLAEFLRARRVRLTPSDVGIVPEPGRRVTGLRREEVADRAGISFDYYVRLEQGRRHLISEQVLAALGHALQLDDPSREYMYRLALPAPTDAWSHSLLQISPVIPKLLKQWEYTSATVFDRHQDILFANDLATALSPDSMPDRNIVKTLFTATESQRLNPDWRMTARISVAALRFYGDPTSPRLHKIVGELSVHDRDFREIWAAHEVSPFTSGTAPNYVPGFGWVDLKWQIFEVPGGYFLHVALFEPNTRAAAAMEYLTAALRAGPAAGEARPAP